MNHSKTPFFRRRLRVLPGLAGFLLFLTGCGGPAKPAPPAGRPGDPGKEPTSRSETQGLVMGYGSNQNGDIDELAIKNDSGISVYHFPPHLARTVMGIAKKNTRVELWYGDRHRRKPADPSPAPELMSLRSTVSNQIFDLRGLPPPPPKPGSIIVLEGVPAVQNTGGRERFFLLAGHRVALSPRAAETLLPMIAGSKHVTVKGEQRDADDGFVSAAGAPLVRARELSIDSVKYVIE